MVNRRPVQESDSDSDSDIVVYPPTPPRQRTPPQSVNVNDSDTNDAHEQQDYDQALIIRNIVSSDLLRVASPATDRFQFEQAFPQPTGPNRSTGTVHTIDSDSTVTQIPPIRGLSAQRQATNHQVPPEDQLPRHTSLRRIVEPVLPASSNDSIRNRTTTPLPTYSQAQVRPPSYTGQQANTNQTATTSVSQSQAPPVIQPPQPRPAALRQVRITEPTVHRLQPNINISVNSTSDSQARRQDSNISSSNQSQSDSSSRHTRSTQDTAATSVSGTSHTMHGYRRRRKSNASSGRDHQSSRTVSDSHSSQRSRRSESLRDTPVSEYNPEFHVSTHVTMDVDAFKALELELSIPPVFADPRLNVLNQFVKEYDHLRDLTRPSIIFRMMNRGSHYQRVYQALTTTVTDVEPPFVVNSSSPASPALLLRLFYASLRSRGKKISSTAVSLPHFRQGKVLTAKRFEQVVRSTYLLNDKLRNDYGITSTKSSDL
jgi:hypothetical protein